MKQTQLENYSNYIIYEDGQLFNTKTKNWLSGTVNKAGYRVYAIRFNGKKTDQLVHRLVAKAFIPNPDNLPVVNHKDGQILEISDVFFVYFGIKSVVNKWL